jgi:hypothetical protein
VFILKGVKVLCFDTLLQVFILKVVAGGVFHRVRDPHMAAKRTARARARFRKWALPETKTRQALEKAAAERQDALLNPHSIHDCEDIAS